MAPERVEVSFVPVFPGYSEEAEIGFEPMNNGFAIRPLSPLGYSAQILVPTNLRQVPGTRQRHYCKPLSRVAF